MARKQRYLTVAEKQAAYRNRKMAHNLLRNGLEGQLVLELFPGAGLFGKAFSELGACVVRGPDILYGNSIDDFRGVINRFDGIIGGPPCQTFSKAAITGSNKPNLIPQFLRIVDECKPMWAILENVEGAKAFAPNWPYTFLSDWDCGGKTFRKRGFWFYNLAACPKPPKRPGRPEYSVLASNWNYKGTTRVRGYAHMTAERAADLQGYPSLGGLLVENQPGWKRANGSWDGVSTKSRQVLAVHMIGNGVPRALGLYLARWVAFSLNDFTDHFEQFVITSQQETTEALASDGAGASAENSNR